MNYHTCTRMATHVIETEHGRLLVCKECTEALHVQSVRYSQPVRIRKRLKSWTRELADKPCECRHREHSEKEEAGVMRQPKLFHVVMEHSTTTFLSYDDLLDFMGEATAEDLLRYVVCESEVAPEEYDRVSRWAGAVGGGSEEEAKGDGPTQK